MLFVQLFNYYSAVPRVFWAYWHMHQDWDFNKSIGEHIDRQTDKSYGSI